MGKNKWMLILLGVLVLALVAVVVILFLPETTAGGGRNVTGSSGDYALCLSDGWTALGDEDGIGMTKKWYENFPSYGEPIQLPGTARDVTKDVNVWYANTFTPKLDTADGRRVFVELSGITYYCDAWLNGVSLGPTHEGGNETYRLEVTDLVKNGEENLLVLQVYAPKDTTLGQVNTGKPRIQQPVYLCVTPQIYASDVFLEPDQETGEVSLTVTLNNPTGKTKKVDASFSISPSIKNMTLNAGTATLSAAPGDSVHTMKLQVDQPHLWSPDDPFLYRVDVEIGGRTTSITTGFKSFYVDDEGFFVLNGERFYVKCCHTVAQVPGSYDTSREIDILYQELLYLKSCGFNMVRFLMNGALPEQIALCDQIGLLVYEESPAAWKVVDSDKTEEQFHNLVSSVLKRDRNHVSLTMFGMLNETNDVGDTARSFQAAVNELSSARELVPNLLIMLGSGRWDGEKTIASASNPGTDTWTAWMGTEGENAGKVEVSDTGYAYGMGDVHLYPAMPYSDWARNAFASISAQDGARATFVSEAGAGSQANVIGELLNLEEMDVSRLSFEYGILTPQVAQIRDIYEKYGCDQLYSSPEAMLTATQNLQASQRELLFDMIRSNGMISGYSLTMSTDTGFTGEGIMSVYGTVKENMTQTLQEGWADLRWCMVMESQTIYSDETLNIQISLSDVANVLKEGKEYPVILRITGDAGTVWEKEITVKANGTFVIPVLDEKLALNLPEGTYKISADMTSGAHPLCTERTFYVIGTTHKALIGKIGTVNVSDKVCQLLKMQGATVIEGMDAPVILVGSRVLDTDTVCKLAEKAAGGAHVVFLDAAAIVRNESGALNLPFALSGIYSYQYDWLYHKEHIVFDTALTDGLQDGCLLDPSYYSDVYSNYYISGMAVPDTLGVMVFSAGLNTWTAENSVIDGYQLGTYTYYDGAITVNTLKLVDNVGSPVADRLLVDIVASALADGKTAGTCAQGVIDEINELIR